MKGDFTRDSFDAYHHFTRVQLQQGRVQLDADWNEQADIAQHYLRALAADLIGPFGGPKADCGFAMVTDATAVSGMVGKYGLPLPAERVKQLQDSIGRGDFVIGPGRYYVDGMLCENDIPLTYSEQLGYPFAPETALERLVGAKQVLVYLDVWERHVTAMEAPDMLEVALGGPDTATRVQLVWQVKVFRGDGPQSCADIGALQRGARPLMRAKAMQPEEQLQACVIDPAARYRGAENQLYRVEIHRGGHARADGQKNGGATFKWSRENGSVTFPIRTYAEDSAAGETTVSLASLGRDRRFGLAQDAWVEVVDDVLALRDATEPLRMVERIDRDDLEVVLSGVGAGNTGQDQALHPLLRRWDHDASDPSLSEEGALLVREASDSNDVWIELEDGVMIQFPASTGEPNTYWAGDYWLVPARTATGDVIWPRRQVSEDEIEWEARPPAGVEHHYAPVAVATLGDKGDWTVESPDCRLTFDPSAH